jgi:hypothetical protein
VGVVIQPDGKIVVGGTTVLGFNNSEADSAFALVRYNPEWEPRSYLRKRRQSGD